MSDYSANIIANYGFDSGSNVFEPDVMLPSQYLLPDENGVSGGERKLMAALLSDGIEAYIHQAVSQLGAAEYDLSASKKSRPRLDACEWVEAKDDSYVFSFDNVCECLGIDPEYLRLGLFRYVEAIRRMRSADGTGSSIWKKIRRPRKQ